MTYLDEILYKASSCFKNWFVLMILEYLEPEKSVKQKPTKMA